MPTYCYETKDGKIHEIFFDLSMDVPREIVVEGNKIAKRSYQAESPSVPALSGWPLECVASGVNAAQAGELRKHFKKSGVPTEVSPDGNPIYRDPRHRKKALASRGMFDKDAFI